MEEKLTALEGGTRALLVGSGQAAVSTAVLALAGELATEFGISRWPPGEAIRAAKVSFDSWLNMRGQEMGNSEEAQIIESVITFVERHGDSRFSALPTLSGQNPMPTRDRAGYWMDIDGERTYLFTSSGLREALRGYDFKRALVVLQNGKLIDPPDAQGKHSRLKRIDGIQQRLYFVHLARRVDSTNVPSVPIAQGAAF